MKKEWHPRDTLKHAIKTIRERIKRHQRRIKQLRQVWPILMEMGCMTEKSRLNTVKSWNSEEDWEPRSSKWEGNRHIVEKSTCHSFPITSLILSSHIPMYQRKQIVVRSSMTCTSTRKSCVRSSGETMKPYEQYLLDEKRPVEIIAFPYEELVMIRMVPGEPSTLTEVETRRLSPVKNKRYIHIGRINKILPGTFFWEGEGMVYQLSNHSVSPFTRENKMYSRDLENDGKIFGGRNQ